MDLNKTKKIKKIAAKRNEEKFVFLIHNNFLAGFGRKKQNKPQRKFRKNFKFLH